MGGFFSTRWNHVRTRQDTDSLLYLDVRWLARLAGKSARLIRAGNVSPDDDDLTKAWETFSAGGGQHLYYVQGNASTSVETIRTLRHTAAKLRRQSGASLEDVQTVLGHANIAKTARYLARLEGAKDTGWAAAAQLLESEHPHG